MIETKQMLNVCFCKHNAMLFSVVRIDIIGSDLLLDDNIDEKFLST